MRVVLRGVDLEIPAGGRLALVGPSGAGKTTLLRVIAGLEPSATGRVEAGGRALDGLPPHRRPIAMVFQEPRLLPNLDAAENVAFALRAAGVGRRERRTRADALLAEVGLDGLGRRGVRGMSGGEQQRIALARALCPDPGLLLLDEPMASVDPDRREGLRRLILRLQAERRVTTLIVTHDRDEAAEMGEAIALMIEGRVVQCDTPRNLFLRPQTPAVARFFGTRNILGGEVRDGAARRPRPGPSPRPGPTGRRGWRSARRGSPSTPDGPLAMTVREAIFTGSVLRVRLARGDMRLEARVPPDPARRPGTRCGSPSPAEAVWRFPDDDAVPARRAAASSVPERGAPRADARSRSRPPLLVVLVLWGAGMVGAVRSSLGREPPHRLVGRRPRRLPRAAGDPAFWEALWFTLRITAVATVVSAVVAVALAAALRRSGVVARLLASVPVPMPHLVAAVLGRALAGPGRHRRPPARRAARRPGARSRRASASCSSTSTRRRPSSRCWCWRPGARRSPPARRRRPCSAPGRCSGCAGWSGRRSARRSSRGPRWWPRS